MSDSYGVLIFKKSRDCSLDGQELVRRMNKFRWSNDDTLWEWDEDRQQAVADSDCTQYPCAYPTRIERVLVETDGGDEIWVDFADAGVPLEDTLDRVEEEPELEELCAYLAPAIKSGWIEVTSVCNDRLKFASYQSLQVYANGHGVSQLHFTGLQYPAGSNVSVTKNFDPPLGA